MIGVQRQVVHYETSADGKRFFAVLTCGHSAELTVEPLTDRPRQPRYIDCPTCTADRDRSQAASATSTPKETP